jgi:hypothetical protein
MTVLISLQDTPIPTIKPRTTQAHIDLKSYVGHTVPGHAIPPHHKGDKFPPDTQVSAYIPEKDENILCIVKSYQGNKVEIEDVCADEVDGTKKYVLFPEET